MVQKDNIYYIHITSEFAHWKDDWLAGLDWFLLLRIGKNISLYFLIHGGMVDRCGDGAHDNRIEEITDLTAIRWFYGNAAAFISCPFLSFSFLQPIASLSIFKFHWKINNTYVDNNK